MDERQLLQTETLAGDGSDRRELLLDRIERTTELPLMILSFAMIPLVAASFLWELRPAAENLVLALRIGAWAIFAADLVVRTAIAPRRLPYLRQHWLDVLVVLFPPARPLRILWILAHGSRAYNSALRLVRVDFLAVYALGLVLLIATLVTLAERGHDSPIDSFLDALWWSVATVTTVGYGDVVPVTQVGRALAYVLMIGGIGLFSALTANFAALLTRRDRQTTATLALLTEEVRQLRETVARQEERGGHS